MLKIIHNFLLLNCIIFVLLPNILKVSALDTGFKTKGLSIEDKNTFISNTDLLLIDEEPTKNPILCFDVNNNQLIAVGQRTSGRKAIYIYSNEGVFQYGYTFNCTGDFGVEWDENNLNIYFVRSSVLATVSPHGEILDILEVQNTIENNSYVNHFIYSDKRLIDCTEYFIGNPSRMLNLFAPSYSQITVKTGNGSEYIIYDVSSIYFSKMIGTIVFFCLLVIAGVAVMIRQFIKMKHG